MTKSTRNSFAAAIALGSFALIGGTGLTVSSAWLITMASQHPPILTLGVSIVMVRFFGIFRSIARYGERVISHEAIFRKLTGIRVDLFRAVASRLKSSSRNISQESKAMIDDVERAQEFHLRVTLPELSALVAGTVTVLLALWISQLIFIWIVAAIVIFALAIPYLVRRFLDPIAVAIEELENEFTEEISSAAHALVEAEVFGYADQYQLRLDEKVDSLAQLEKQNFLRTSLLQALTIATTGFTLVAVATTVYSHDELLPIQISMAIFLVLVGFEGYTSWFPNLFPAGKNRRAAQSVDSHTQVEIEPDREVRRPSASLLEIKEVVPYWNERFLAPISFAITPGETVVISGASGVGKSTLAAALFGLARYDGEITLGGIALNSIANPAREISGTLQHGHIFNTTLRENLKIANPEATDKDLQRALQLLELEAIPLDEVLGEFGRKLSGGEAKRLSVARALLAPAPILILDEPLEHLDYERSLRIQRAISQECANRALIVITHSPWLQYSRKLTLARE